MIEVKKKSVIPIYGVGAVWALYCLFLPLFRTWHFIVLAIAAALAYIVLSKIFPGKIEYIEIPQEPIQTGDEKADALLREGEAAVAELRRMRQTFPDGPVRAKLDELIVITEKIFKRIIGNPGEYTQIRRFADHYLPMTTKLLRTYEDFSAKSVRGENIEDSIHQIDNALSSVLESYKTLYDSLYKHQAMDIEADIKVLETLLKREGFMDN